MQTNKSDFYKRTYSSKLDTSNIKTSRSNSKNLDYSNYRTYKKTDVYSDKSGIYEVSSPDNTHSKNKFFFSSKLIFVVGVVGIMLYLNNNTYLSLNNFNNFNNLPQNNLTLFIKSIAINISNTLGELNNKYISIPSFNTSNTEVNSDLIKIDENIIDYINQDIQNINNSNFVEQSNNNLNNNNNLEDDSLSNSIKN